jgi:HEPN domain-containing protein
VLSIKCRGFLPLLLKTQNLIPNTSHGRGGNSGGTTGSQFTASRPDTWRVRDEGFLCFMNRADLKRLAMMRLSDARRLLRTRRNDAGAYYMAGYAIECALKACIARNMGQYPFPPLIRDAELKQFYYTHDLTALLKTARLEALLNQERAVNPTLDTYWGIVTQWSETRRYETQIARAEAESMITAIEEQTNGVLTWLKNHW